MNVNIISHMSDRDEMVVRPRKRRLVRPADSEDEANGEVASLEEMNATGEPSDGEPSDVEPSDVEPLTESENEEPDDGSFAPNAFVDDMAEGVGSADEADEADEDPDSSDDFFIDDVEEVAQGGVDMRDSGGECKSMTFSIRDLYTGTSFRAIYARDDGRTAFVDVRVPPAAPGTVLRFQNFEIKLCHEPSVGSFTVTDGGLLQTTVRVDQLDAITGPATLQTFTPDGKEHTVECGMALIDGDVLPAPRLGFGSADMLCKIKVIRSRLSTAQRNTLRQLIKSL